MDLLLSTIVSQCKVTRKLKKKLGTKLKVEKQGGDIHLVPNSAHRSRDYMSITGISISRIYPSDYIIVPLLRFYNTSFRSAVHVYAIV